METLWYAIAYDKFMEFVGEIERNGSEEWLPELKRSLPFSDFGKGD